MKFERICHNHERSRVVVGGKHEGSVGKKDCVAQVLS